MLEFNNYNTLKIENLKDLFTIIFVLVDDAYKQIIPDEIKFRKNYSRKKLSDSEIITISLVGEAHKVSSENAWFNYVKRNFSDLFPDMGDRSRFNKTRRNLCVVTERIRQHFMDKFNFSKEEIGIIDSIPIPVCKFARAYFSKCFKDISEYGYCASKKETYYGVKLHAIVTLEGCLTDFFLTPANVDDREAAFEVFSKSSHKTVLGDKGYIGDDFSKKISKETNTNIVALKRKNSKNAYPKEMQKIFTAKRRRVETAFSQLTEQFEINKVYAKTKLGLRTRLVSKIFSHNILYIINTIIGSKNIGKIKELIF